MSGSIVSGATVRERGKRWLRIHVTDTQSRDLFYPCSAPPGEGVLAPTIQLLGTSAPPTDIHINGERADLLDIVISGSTFTARVAREDLVLPGENVVSLPVSCDPREVRLFAVRDGRFGWGTRRHGNAETQSDPISASARFILSSLSRDPFGPGIVSLTAWDRQHRCERLWSWYWTTALAYEALADLVDAGSLQTDLAGIEDGFLGRQVMATGESRGSYFVRWDPDRCHPGGVQSWHAPNDAAFIGLHGLLVAHRRGSQGPWLDRAALLADWILGHGMNGDRLRVGWNAVDGRWDDSWHYLDAAWTPAFFMELTRLTGERRYEEHAVALAQDTIARFATPGPFYLKIWRANGRHTRTVFARGMAWVLEGWIPLALAGQDWLVPRVRELVRGLLAHQQPDGAWPYLLDRPASGPCNKGTPAIACHLQRAMPLLPDLAAEIRDAVTSALAWCEQQMDMDPGSPSFGGIFAHNEEGAIATVRNIPVAVNYASAYYILTRRERER